MERVGESSLLRRVLVRWQAALIWLSRIAYCRGFGIQSPSAYAFVRYVINEHYPYYAYQELDTRFPKLDFRQRKLCRFLFRLANWLQPSLIIDAVGDLAPVRRAYFHAGCRKACVQEVGSYEADIWRLEDTNATSTLLMVADTEAGHALCEEVLSHADSRMVMVIAGIRRNRRARRWWHEVASSPRTGVTYDLYDCGVVMFDLTKYKQQYKVNF